MSNINLSTAISTATSTVWQQLPKDIIIYIATFLPLKSFIKIPRFNKYYKSIIYNNPNAWNNYVCNPSRYINNTVNINTNLYKKSTYQYIKQLNISLDYFHEFSTNTIILKNFIAFVNSVSFTNITTFQIEIQNLYKGIRTMYIMIHLMDNLKKIAFEMYNLKYSIFKFTKCYLAESDIINVVDSFKHTTIKQFNLAGVIIEGNDTGQLKLLVKKYNILEFSDI